MSPDINLIRKLYNQGLSWKVICEKTDISTATLSKILKENKSE
jgi:DNA invertase Pin-like site-specific DNA recombinase